MRRLAVYLKTYEKETILAPLFKALEVVFDLLVPVVVAQMIDVGVAGGDTGYMIRQTLLLILLALLGLCSSVTAQYFAAKVSVGFATKLRQSVFDHVQRFSYAELDTIGTSTLITRLTDDINQVQNGLNMGLRLLLRSPLVVIGSMIMAFIAIYGVTNDQFQANIYGSAASLIFIGIYLGLIFLIASVAVLAIQQLSEASESIGRYRALQRMGVPDKLIRRSVLQQILFYFALPLGLAVVDSIFGIHVTGERFNQFHLSVFNGMSLIAIIIFAFIFSGYLYVTYKGYQNVIAKTQNTR